MQRAQIQFLDIQRRGFDYHLELVVMLQAIGIFAITTVGGPARGLHIGGGPGFGADGTNEGGGMKGAGPHFHVVGLQDDAALFGPVLLQGEDQPLEGMGGGGMAGFAQADTFINMDTAKRALIIAAPSAADNLKECGFYSPVAAGNDRAKRIKFGSGRADDFNRAIHIRRQVVIDTDHTPLSQWHTLVSEAEQAVGITLEPELESYLVFTLMRYLDRPEMAQRVLALDYLEAAHCQGREQQERLRDVGDQCLLYSGLFPRRAERRRVRISYYVDLGRSAYHHLGSCGTAHATLYAELARIFVIAMDILQAIRNLRREQQLDPLGSLELWQDTGSNVARKSLKQVTDATLQPDPDARKRGGNGRLH